MDVGSIVSSFVQDVNQTSQQRNQERAELLVQKKALDLQEENALALIESVTASAPSTASSGNLGTQISVKV